MRLQSASSVSDSLSGSIFLANCLFGDLVGDVVYITGPKVGNLYQVSRVDIDDPAKAVGKGVIIEKTSSTECTVRRAGIILGVYTGLTPDKALFVGTNGRLQEGPPARPVSGRRYFQQMATALSSADLVMEIQQPSIIIA
jgi:hypothetical protein